ncbi:hypothetical protein [Labilithrix luteola]|uniref:hypothetical protein n=1 Tax=Labilithrix luteola TaxID=1391654 RepID=UPI0011BA4E5D|nr:hypothetical protein [Labilithrix luteola]
MAALRRLTGVFCFSILAAAAAAACGSDEDPGNGANPPGGPNGFDNDGSVDPNAQPFDVTPADLQTITVTTGQPAPTVEYKATLNGQPIAVGWSIDRGDIGAIPKGPSTSSIFTPKGTSGGLATISAGLNGRIVTRQVFVKVVSTQNGADPNAPGESGQIPKSPDDLKAGGGVGGVGGEGLGGAVTDPAIISALGSPQDGSGQNLGLLYPYDKTFFPRGQLAPLLMWRWTTGDADAIKIELSTSSGSFTYSGTFGRPAILPSTKFTRHPIPQDIWDIATNSAGGKLPDGTPDRLTVKLTVAKGTQAYGPIVQTWNVAPARLSGTVYYNSYGTQLVKNWTALDKKGHAIGAAILGIRSGQLGPQLVVGKDSPKDGNGNPADNSGCRVCHVVSSRGRWLVTQAEQGTPGNGRSFLYDLSAADVPNSSVQLANEGVFAWAAMTQDGSFALTNSVDPSSSNPGISGASNNTAKSSFWQFGATPTTAPMSGLPNNVAAGYPVFSPDDKKVAYIDATGATKDVHGALVVADYDAATHAFTNLKTIVTPAAGERIGFPSFLPDNSGIIYETEVRPSQSDSVMVTRDGARSEIWWVSLADGATPVRLDALNGKTSGALYLPKLPNNHGAGTATDPRSSYDETNLDDSTLHYEPTVLPIAVGGRAWVVFTSRRAYGNQLTATPWQSWPPDYDTTDLNQGAVKKLWVAAIDLGAAANSDPSHPAFYLPAQEILAGNSRGFWVLDPCKSDGEDCSTGDQCCNGFCQPNADETKLVCTNAPPANSCSGIQEKCTTSADCCDKSNQCINGFCAQGVK